MLGLQVDKIIVSFDCRYCIWHFTDHRMAENSSSTCLQFAHGHSREQGSTLPLALTAVSLKQGHLNNGAVDDYAACDDIISVINRQAASPISLTGTLKIAKGRSRVRNATASSSAGVQVKHRLALCIAFLASIMVQNLCMAIAAAACIQAVPCLLV